MLPSLQILYGAQVKARSKKNEAKGSHREGVIIIFAGIRQRAHGRHLSSWLARPVWIWRTRSRRRAGWVDELTAEAKGKYINSMASQWSRIEEQMNTFIWLAWDTCPSREVLLAELTSNMFSKKHTDNKIWPHSLTHSLNPDWLLLGVKDD